MAFDPLLAFFWTLMVLKCVLLSWAIQYWAMPVSHLFIWTGSMGGMLLITLVYKGKF